MAKFNGTLNVFGNIKSKEFPQQVQVNDTVADATTTAPGVGLPAAATGQRYILVANTGALNGAWGSISGVGDNDIVEYDGTNWFVAYDVSVQPAGACTYDLDANGEVCYNGSEWSTSGAPGGGDGITFNAGQNRYDLDLANTTPGLELTASDGTGELRLSAQGNGIAGGAGSLLSVLADSTGGANLATAINVSANGVAIAIDDSSVGENGSNQLEVKDLGISTAKIADAAVTVAKIEILAEGELIVGNGVANSKVATASVGDILSDETNGLTIKANAVGTTEIADANVTVAKIEVLAEGELIVGNGVANSKVDTSSVGDILSDETNGLTIKADAVDSAEIAADAVKTSELDFADTNLRSGVQSDPFTASLTRTFTHSWGTTSVIVDIFDATTGETCYADMVVRNSNDVTITLAETPANNLTVLLREVKAETTLVVS
jgi:hypothetical protein